MEICKICFKEYNRISDLFQHLRSHKISKQEYYDKFILKDLQDKICPFCEKDRKYHSIKVGYLHTCGNKKCHLLDIKKTKKERYGNENYNNREKAIETNLRLFKNICPVHGINEGKAKITKLNNIDKNGLNSFDRQIIKSKQTKLERYGNENYNNIEKQREVMNNLYGGYTLVSKILSNKVKNTLLEKYGTDNYFKSEAYKNKFKNNEFVFNLMAKVYETKKKNNSFIGSKIEQEFKKLLNIFELVYEQNYRSDLYPFNCDFYIPKLDLYIELNFHWTHGHEPFNIYNKKHIEILKEWTRKGNELNFKDKKKEQYFVAIYVWTNLDVKKLEVAKKNHLNYIQIYRQDEFEKVIKDILYLYKREVNKWQL